AEVRAVEFHLAVGAGGNVVVDAVGEAEPLPALALDEPAPALDADRAAVGQRIEDVLAVLEAAVPGPEGLGLRPRRRDRPVGRTRTPVVLEVGDQVRRSDGDRGRAAGALRDVIGYERPRPVGEVVL